MAIIGIDIGTQSLKVVVTDDRLRVLGSGSVSYRPSYPQPGWAVQDPQLWLDGLRPAIDRALRAAQVQPSAVAAIGIAAQLDGCVPVDAAGHALAPGIIWMDRRAEAEVRDIPAELVRERAGLVRDSTHMAAKIRWYQRHGRFAAPVRTWHQPTSFVVERLTGAVVFDHGLASTTMLYGLALRDFDPVLLDAFGIDRTRLPGVADAGDAAGALHADGATLCGLRAGIPVVVGTGDDFSSALGAGVVAPGTLACSVGTAEALGAVSDALVIDHDGLVETHGYAGGRWYIGNPGWLSGGAVTWFCDTFSVESAEAVSALAEQASDGCDGVTFLPALSGAMAPRWVADARGAFVGLAANHGKPELARAVLEGCAFAMRDVVDRLRELGVPLHTIRLTGGGARSRVWSQIRADLTGLPVEINPVVDASPLGAATLAAQVVGGGALQAPPANDLVILAPRPAHGVALNDAYQRYRTLFDALAPHPVPS